MRSRRHAKVAAGLAAVLLLVGAAGAEPGEGRQGRGEGVGNQMGGKPGQRLTPRPDPSRAPGVASPRRAGEERR